MYHACGRHAPFLRNGCTIPAVAMHHHLRSSFTFGAAYAAEGVTEELKARDQLAWVGAMNSIRSHAEEIILRELIYEEDAV